MKTLYLLMAFVLIHCGNSLPEKTPSAEKSLSQNSEELTHASKGTVFTFDQIKNMTDSELSDTLRDIRDKQVILNNKPVPHFKDLKSWNLHELNNNKLDSIFYYIIVFGYLGQITAEQLQAISSEGLGKINFIIKCLTPQQTKNFTLEQISNERIIYDLTAPQIAEFNSAQVNAIGHALTDEELHVVAPDIIKEMDYPNIPFHRLSRPQVEAVTPEQLSLDNVWGKGINQFLPEQIPWLTPEQISAHPLYQRQDPDYPVPFQPIKPELLAAMSLEQTQAVSIEHSYEFKKEHWRSLSLNQLYIFEENPEAARIIKIAEQGKDFLRTTKPTDYQYYTNFILSMIPEDFTYFTYRQARHFPHNLTAFLTTSRIKHFRHYAKLLNPDFLEYDLSANDPAFHTYPIDKEKFRAIPLEQIPDLSIEFLKAMTNIQVYWFTFEKLTHLTPDQLYMLAHIQYDSFIDMDKLFSIIYIAEQAGDKGHKWLRGPMKEVIVENKKSECKEEGKDLSTCPGEYWLSFPDFHDPNILWTSPERIREDLRRRHLTLPPDRPTPIPTTRSYINHCKRLKNYIPDWKKRIRELTKEQKDELIQSL